MFTFSEVLFMFAIEQLVLSKMSSAGRRYSSAAALESCELKEFQPTKIFKNDSSDVVKPRKSRPPLLRSSTSYMLGAVQERNLKRVPVLRLGHSDALPDAKDIMQKLKDSSREVDETEITVQDVKSKSVCVVWDLERNCLVEKTNGEIPTVQSLADTEDITTGIFTSKSNIRSPKDNNKYKSKPPLKRSQSEFSMNLPGSLTFNPDDPLESFRSRFALPKSTVSNNDEASNVAGTGISAADRKLLNRPKEKFRRERLTSLSVDEEDSMSKKSGEFGETQNSHRKRYKKDRRIKSSEYDSCSRRVKLKQQRSVDKRSSILKLMEKAVDESLSNTLPSLQNLISAEVERQLKNHSTGDEYKSLSSDIVYRNVYKQLLDHFSNSLDIKCDSEESCCDSPEQLFEDHVTDNLCSRTSSHSVSCLDLTEQYPPQINRNKLTPSLSFAELGLADEMPFSSFSYTKFGKSKSIPHSKSLELLDSSDVEVEGDLNHLPLEHHVPLKNALVPLCRQVSQSIQDISSEEPNTGQAKPTQVATMAKPKPKSLVLKLHVDLDKLEASGESDPYTMEWDYYDPRREDWKEGE